MSGVALASAIYVGNSPRVRAAREALEAAIAADREEGYSPIRGPEHELYNPALTAREREGDDAGLLPPLVGERGRANESRGRGRARALADGQG